jgi:uncharacterized protein (TIGR02453 family)
MSFVGFTAEALKFLFENRMNDSRDWYESHKGEYKQYVYNPFIELVMEVSPAIGEIDSALITIPSKLISRVRRDTRFTKDKSLYRDNAWITFLRDKSRTSNSPCFWFEISQTGSSYGVGYYSAETGSMANLREMILNRHPAFLSALKCFESQNEFVIGGEMYKRSRFPEQPENVRSWLDRKNIYFECAQNDFTLAFSKELPCVLGKGYTKLKPIYDLLCLVGY